MGNFALNIHNMIVNIVGYLPPHLEFIYGIGDIIFIIFVVLFAFSPWILLYKFLDRW